MSSVPWSDQMAKLDRLARSLDVPGGVWGELLAFRERDARVTIDVEVVGPAGAPAVALIPGLGMQRVEWPGSLIRSLVEGGWRCVLFDNRDCGPSSVGTARLSSSLPTYTISDMANDVVRLMDHLQIDSAHVVGVSMGGIIAQRLAIGQPSRLNSLTSIMASTGASDVGSADPIAKFMFKEDIPADLGGFLDFRERVDRVTRAPRDFDAEHCYNLSLLAFARGARSVGRRRQVMALMAETDRTVPLHTVHVPTLVLHGAEDRVVHPSGGLATAQAVANGEFVEVIGMSHALVGDGPMRRLTQILTGFLQEHRGDAGPSGARGRP